MSVRGGILKRFKGKAPQSPDPVLSFCVVALVLFGLVMLSSASSDLGAIKFGDTYYYLKHQIYYGMLIGILGFFAAFFIPYHWYKKIALILLLFSILALGFVFTSFGSSSRGAARWIQIGPINAQPAEFLKITFILYLAAWLSNAKANRQRSISGGLVPLALLTGVISFLIIKQPATSTLVVILGAGFIVYFVSGAKLSYIFGLIAVCMVGLALLIMITPYRWNRVKAFLSPNADQEGIGYHSNQALNTIGSGRIFGVGYGKSTAKYSSLPEPIGDSIFAVIAEELGFVGAVATVGLFFLFVARGFMVARSVRDQFGKLVLLGFSSVIGIQAFIHIASLSGLMPLTGIPMPFISYGGTAFAVFLTMSGMMLNISRFARA